MTKPLACPEARTPEIPPARYRLRIAFLALFGLLISSAIAVDEPGFSLNEALQKPAFSHANDGVRSDLQFRYSLRR